MQPIISDLVSRYERGGLSRRELIQGLASLVAVAATSGAAAAAAAEPQRSLIPSGIDHVSVRVSDLERSAAFYQSLFGLRPLSEDKPHKILRLGDKRVIVSLRQDTPHGQIDHFGVGVPDFDKAEVTKLLEARGLKPQEDWEYGFYVRDPDGVPVQMVKAG
jgi:catechol 2,3-dioxygenase-like lactoylglutathione lyase family enzyme